MTVALVTGASAGLGRALAVGLAVDGFDLVIDARRPDALEETARVVHAHSTAVRAIAGDVVDPEHRRRLVDAAADMGGVDLLVNNAGALGPAPLPRLEEFEVGALEQLVAVNVVAPLALIQLALPSLRRRRGTVVAVTSDAAVEAYEGWGGYGASKAAFEQLHHVLSEEEPDITVIRFDPGDMRTQMHQDAFPGEDISDRPEPEVAAGALRRLLASHAPGGRYRVADVPGAIR